MDLELEFTDAEFEALQRMADREGCSVEEVVLAAITKAVGLD